MDGLLQQFHFEVEYRPGKNHGNADALSRRHPTQQAMAVIQEWGADVDTLKENQLADAQIAPVVEALQEGKPPPSNSSPRLRRAFIQNGLLYHKFRESSLSVATTQLVVPCTMKSMVLWQLHNESGQLGVRRTMERVKE